MQAAVLTIGLMLAAGMVLIAAAVHDLAFRTVPNWMPLVIAALAVAVQALAGHLAGGGAAGGIVFGLAALCWRRGWMGGGDTKLLGASAMLVPPALVMRLLLNISLAGGVLAIGYLVLGRLLAPHRTGHQAADSRPPGLLARIWRAERFRIRRRGPLPYASAIAAGVLLVLLGS